ncbi:MAG: arginine--tRNA ligase [Anaerolineae bacterium]|nr:arginine--tRNA ligase [Anaerolineae bacterium]
MIRISQALKIETSKAIETAQSAGDLPAFEIPEISINRPKQADHGDYATPAAMQLARLARMKPDTIAEMIINHFPDTDYLRAIERTSGFINFRLADHWLQQQVEEILAAGSDFAKMDDYAGKRLQVECVSANPTGPITVGRVRGGVMGDTLARLHRAMGYDVEMEYYFNNAGKQMRLLGESLKARYLERLGQESDFPEDGYQGDYLYDIADQLIEEQGNSLADADWETFKDYAEASIFVMIKASLKRIGIEFDVFFNENSLYDDGSVWETLDALREKGLIYEALHPEQDEDLDERPDQEELDATQGEPATWIRMRQLRDVKKDCVVVKSTGEPTYRLPDTAYHINKLDRGFDLLINILGTDHIEEAKDVAAMVGALGYDSSKIKVPLHQFVTITEGGKTVRMSTRKGEFVTLDELVNDVGPNAVRYFMLARSPESHMDFDLELARKQSNENPVYYIQNAHVRCASIERVAAERGVFADDGDVSLLADPRELALIRKLLELPEIIDLAVDELAPHKIAFWAHEELARTFHPIYEEIRALYSDVPEDLAKARLKLYAAARIVIRRTLELMGMSAPDQM